jgi:beta-N-acetylhexosaminidase
MKKPLELKSLTIEQKIGMMLLARSPIDRADKAFMLDMLKNRCLGGIHLSPKQHQGRNAAYGFVTDLPKTELKDEVAEFLAAADYPVLMCEDMELGFRDGTQLPSPMAIAAADSEELAYEFARITAIEAKAMGFNLVFGPIMDIGMNPLSSCVGVRTFGSDPKRVARMSAAAVRGYQDNGMVVTGKHYPGFGESPVDSHIGMVYLNGDEKLLLERELLPYIESMKKADLSGVMVGHIMVPKIDGKYPATLSKKLIGLLRSTGYDGLIMTDSLAMVGLTNFFSLPDCHKLAMAAGNDMVMTSYRTTAKEAYQYLLDAYRSGMVPEAQINAAAARVIAAQNRTLASASLTSLSDRERASAERMAREAITVQLNGAGSAAIDPDGRHLFIIQRGNLFMNEITGQTFREPSDLELAERCVRERFRNSKIALIDQYSDRVQNENILKESMEYDSVVWVTYNKSLSYMGSSDYTGRTLSLIAGMGDKVSAVVLFGNPYAARDLPKVKRILFGFEGECQRYAVDALAGVFKPTGKLPVSF